MNQLDYIVNKLGGNCQAVDAKGSNAFHHLAANAVDRDAVVRDIQSGFFPFLSVPEAEKKIAEKIIEQELFRNKMSEILLKAKCDPYLENSEFETPLLSAISHSNFSFARILLTKMNTPLTARQTPSGKTFLSILADKCIDLDACGLLQGPEYHDMSIIDRYRTEFIKMASICDENGLTPFQIACKHIGTQLRQNREYKIADKTSRFIKFLYTECSADPNRTIPAKKKVKENNESLGELESESDEYKVDTKEVERSAPIFELIDNRAKELINELVDLGRSKGLPKLDMNVLDGASLSPLLRATVDKQSELAIRLIDLNLISALDFNQQIAKSKIKYLNENLLQLCIRHSQFKLFSRFIDLCLSQLDSSMMFQLLKHENAKRQNFLHVLAECDSSEHRMEFSLERLVDISIRIDSHLGPAENLLKLLSSRDKLGRNPLHLVLANYDSSHSNLELETYFLESIWKVSRSDLTSFMFNMKDAFDRVPLHYLFLNSPQFTVFGKSVNDLYSVANVNELVKNEKLRRVGFGERGASSLCDPVELLAIVVKQMGLRCVDDKDVFGYTALHYAAVRGATVSCTFLASKGCDALSRSKSGNTPLSDAIYHNRETCAFALLRSLLDKSIRQPLTDLHSIIQNMVRVMKNLMS